jgi:hypothetical protein
VAGCRNFRLSHCFESAVGKDCWVLIRNIVSDNTPYYESSAKATYNTQDEKLMASILYLNGWQRIQRQDGNNSPVGGFQLTWKPSAKFTLNYSNYLGTEGPDSVSVKRSYHDLYAIVELTSRFGIIAGIDYGIQQKSPAGSGTNYILAPVLIARYAFVNQCAVAGRFEYYKDKNGVLTHSEFLTVRDEESAIEVTKRVVSMKKAGF